MKLNLKQAVMLSLTGLVSMPILAITPDPSDQNIYQREFKLLDADSNSKLSATEIKQDPLFDGGGFAKADKNRNGSLSQDEFATYKSAVQQKEAKQVASDSAITSK
ncbi:MAG: BON domain-containing protein, partial [Methylophilaceae bacterium]